MRILTLLLLAAAVTMANDGAASTAAGGIQLGHEERISLEKERLTISVSKIIVEYEFLNETDKDVSTEVAFPLPAYEATSLDNDLARKIEDFHVWVDGHEIPYRTEARALLGGKDYTARLREAGIDVASLGHFSDRELEPTFSEDFNRLTAQQQKQLRNEGLFNEFFPMWEAHVTHHWQQTFPAHKTLRIRHEYAPASGQMLTGLDDLTQAKPERRHQASFSQWCIEPSLRRKLTALMARDGYSFVSWVDYVLTTANTWKKPIGDFELIVERPKPDWSPEQPISSAKHYAVSFCWAGPVSQPDADHFVARAKSFVPTQELSVAFLPDE